MTSSEVQRTLVKSAPELWAELSDPAALARHLGELGEIRITRVEPEERVEWEGPETSGTVLIKSSGWGTRVTLTATSDADHDGPEHLELTPRPALPGAPPQDQALSESQDRPAASEGEGAGTGEPPSHGEPPATAAPERGPELQTWAQLLAPAAPRITAPPKPESPPEPASQPAPEAGREPAPEPISAPMPEASSESAPELQLALPRRGFFARLLRRRRAQELVTPATVTSEPPASPPLPPPSPPQPAPLDTAATPVERESDEARSHDQSPATHEPAAGEVDAAAGEVAVDLEGERVTAVLTAALDRLGAAHHRPFSRA